MNTTIIIFILAYSEAKTQADLLNPQGEYQANGFLSKPASLEILQRTLREKINKRSSIETKESLIWQF